MGLGDEKTRKQIIRHSNIYRKGPCRECEGPSWTLLFCFLDKGKFVRLNIFQGNRTCFERILTKQQIWGKKSFKMVDAHTDLFKIENLGFIVCKKLPFENPSYCD